MTHPHNPLSLADAIRFGAMLRPQAYGRLLQDGRSCALGAAAEATWAQYAELAQLGKMGQLRLRFPELQCEYACLCHFRRVLPYTLEATIVHWNDEHRFTREQIADFLDGSRQIEADAGPVVEEPIGTGVQQEVSHVEV